MDEESKETSTVVASLFSVLTSIIITPERDEIDAKIFDLDQVREILDELMNQLDSIGEKTKSANSWQKDQLARNILTNLEINNKNEVSFRWKKLLKHTFNNTLTEEFRFGAPD